MTRSQAEAIKVSAVVLAGGRNKPDLTRATGAEKRALVPIHGRSMLGYVLCALFQARLIEGIRVVGSLGIDSMEGVTAFLQEGETFYDNIRIGVQACKTEKVLLVSADVPMLTGAMVDTFIEAALLTGADFCYPIIPMALACRRFPEMQRTSVRIREGEFTGGNIVLVDVKVLLKNESLISHAFSARKSPGRLLQIIGPGLAARFMLSRLIPAAISIPYLERKIASILGVSASAVILPYPEIGADVDKLTDLQAVEKMIRHVP